MKELHDLGFAHCDLKLFNVFIDSRTGEVFLDDLEYLTQLDDPLPHITNLPIGVTEDRVHCARDLDHYQLEAIKSVIMTMN